MVKLTGGIDMSDMENNVFDEIFEELGIEKDKELKDALMVMIKQRYGKDPFNIEGIKSFIKVNTK